MLITKIFSEYLNINPFALALSSALAYGLYRYFFNTWDHVLYDSIVNNDKKAFDTALKNKIDINIRHEHDFTALIIACKKQNLEMVKKILSYENCKVEIFDEEGRTAMTYAAIGGDLEIVKLLVKYKANYKIGDNSGTTPIIYASEHGHWQVVEYLVSLGVDITRRNRNGLNALIVAFNNYNGKQGRFKVIEVLVNATPDLDAVLVSGWTLLIKACYKGYDDLVRHLIVKGANVNVVVKDNGFSPLIAAAQNGWIEVVDILLKNGADPFMQLKDGSTALVAASHGGYHLITELILSFISTNKHSQKSLIQRQSIYEVKDEPLETQLVNMRYKNGGTPLMAAVYRGFIDVVRVLLYYHADINIKSLKNWTVFHIAAENGRAKIMNILLEEDNAKFDECNDQGYTPLMIACKFNYTQIVQILIDYKAKVNHLFLSDDDSDEKEQSKDKENEKNSKIPLIFGYLTPLMLSISVKNMETVELLLKAGADVNFNMFDIMDQDMKFPKDEFISSNYADSSSNPFSKSNDSTEMKANSTKDTKTKPSKEEIRKLKEIEKQKQRQLLLEEEQKQVMLIYSHFSTPLLLAIYLKNEEILRALLKNGAITDGTDSTNSNGLRPIELAASLLDIPIVLILMDHMGINCLKWDFTRDFIYLIFRLIIRIRIIDIMKIWVKLMWIGLKFLWIKITMKFFSIKKD